MAEAETFETVQLNPVWNTASYPDVVNILTATDYTFKVWDGDWCGDRHGRLPDFAAALDAADAPAEQIDHYPVEKADDGSKVGPPVEEYDIELIPTVVIERNGEEVVRFVGEENVPITVYLTDELLN